MEIMEAILVEGVDCMRIGTGWDIHKLVPGRILMLGGVAIPHDLGEAGHSDGDVLIHAIIDAMLGATAQGDIGAHFPVGDPRWKDASGLQLLQLVLAKINGYKIVNIDSTVILEEPKLQNHIRSIRISIAEACGLGIDCVSVKAKTAERLLGELGAGDAVVAQAVVLMEQVQDQTPAEYGSNFDWV